MLAVIIVFVLAGAASLRSSHVYSKAEVHGASARKLNHLARVGSTYAVVMILAGFMVVGTLETTL